MYLENAHRVANLDHGCAKTNIRSLEYFYHSSLASCHLLTLLHEIVDRSRVCVYQVVRRWIYNKVMEGLTACTIHLSIHLPN